MSVLVETTVGDLVIDLLPGNSALNFVKLCKLKYYNHSIVHSVERDFLCQMGDRRYIGLGNSSCWGDSFVPDIVDLEYSRKGIVAFTCTQGNGGAGLGGVGLAGHSLRAVSQFFITLSDRHLDYLDGKHAAFGHVVEGLEVLDMLNATLVDDSKRPFKDIRIKHTVILDDPYPDPPGLVFPDKSPEITREILDLAR